MKTIVVVGGGIAGLTAAYRLQESARSHKLDLRVTLLEASSRLGGKILTEHSDSLILEVGPDSFLTAKPHALDLIRELELGNSLLPTRRNNTDVFVYSRGRLRRLPEGLMLLAPTRILPFLRSNILSWRGKLRMGLDLILPAGNSIRDETMGDFARRRFGREVLETIVQPILAGIYAGDADRLSLRSTFPKLIDLEQKYGSVIRGLRQSAGKRPHSDTQRVTPFMSLSGGLGELVEALSFKLNPGTVHLNSRVSAIQSTGLQYRVSYDSGDFVICDTIILTSPAWATAKLTESIDSDLSQELEKIPFSSSATVSFLYEREQAARVPNGFGFVVRQGESRCVSAATFTSHKFPSRVGNGNMLIRCFLGGEGREPALELDDQKLVSAALDDLKIVLGLEAVPRAIHLHRWPRANPQYVTGHAERLHRIELSLLRHPGLWLAGASYYGVGIPDCIASAIDAARSALEYLFHKELKSGQVIV